jgi:hypothetical protein
MVKLLNEPFQPMTIELYAAPELTESEAIDSPISNTTGVLPDQEPTLDASDLLGTFDSREEAMSFVQQQAELDRQTILDNEVTPFNVYTRVERLVVKVQNGDQSTQYKNYYLVTDEGY